MKSSLGLIFAFVILFFSCSKKQTEIPLTYFSTMKVDTVDHYFGKSISDPYRWLENDTTAQTGEWVKKENEITSNYIQQIPFTETIRKRLTEVYHYPKIPKAPIKQGNNLFYLKNDGKQNQYVLYIQEGNDEKNTRVLIDPNQLDNKGLLAISSFSVNQAGNYLACNFSEAGSDWEIIRVFDIKTGKQLSDEIKWVKFNEGAGWYENGFYYSAFDAPQPGKELSNLNFKNKIYYHHLGDKQEKDQMVYEEKGSKRFFIPFVFEKQGILILSAWENTSGEELIVKDLKKNTPFVYCAQSFKDQSTVIGFLKNKILLLTNKKAPRFQIVSVDPAHPEEKNWKTIVPENKNLLRKATVAKNKIVAEYLENVVSRLIVLNPENGKEEKKIELPDLGAIEQPIFGDDKIDEIYFTFETFSNPISIYKYDLVNSSLNLFYKPTTNFNSEDYETKQIFYPSKDGTKIPMFITYKKGLDLTKNNPLFLYGYGGFNISVTPRFSPSRILWLENGGILAIANIRGGGEYGEAWHEAGTKCKKQNVFDDFISAAEYLIKNNYTSSEKLVINGGSNGGLLVGAVMLQRPDLFKVAIPSVGVLDMLRYHKFTIGWTWSYDYGTSDNKEEFECLLKYSPLHNVKETNYPATLITTADHDDRVVPAHSFKFAATLQEKQKAKNPILIRIETGAGHGAGKPVSKQIDEATDMYSFIFYQVGLKPIEK